jgi:phosphate transport system substrate-binding protein
MLANRTNVLCLSIPTQSSVLHELDTCVTESSHRCCRRAPQASHSVATSASIKMHRRSVVLLFLLCPALSFLGCSKKPAGQEGPAGATEHATLENIALTGAGATFPYPLYSKWMSDYHTLHPNVEINYQSIGSGGGIRQITAHTVDFGASDAPMTTEEIQKAPAKIQHIPTTLGAVCVTYHLAGVSVPLKLEPDVLADIYLGKIKKWNDARLAADNSAIKLPAADIAVVYRSDGSGTTAVFTDYLSKVSPEFKEKVGQGKSVKWPLGLGAKGNEGVTGQVKTTPNTIGYVELAYAVQNKLPTAALKNKAGEFIQPSIEAVTAAAAGVVLPDTLTASITNSGSPKAYPISSYTYLLVYEDMRDLTKGKALAEFLWWAIHDGQRDCAPLNYAPLPAAVVAKVEVRLKSLMAAGKPALAGL